jgi:hypothetical protein
LETKWGLIKHDLAKFCGNYGTLVAVNESGTSSEDTLQKALELFKSKHPKQNGTFAFIHCWLIFKDVLRWSKTREESKKVMSMKRKMLMDVGTFDSLDEFQKIEIGIEHGDDYNEHKVLKRPQGSCVMKDELKNRAMRDCALKTSKNNCRHSSFYIEKNPDRGKPKHACTFYDS